jgi:integrase
MGVTVHKKNATGDWYVWICYKGQRTSRKIGKDKRTALKAATKYRKELALGQVDFTNGRRKSDKDILFGHFCEIYLNKVAKHRLKYNSWRSYENLIKLYLLPAWKNKSLDSITRQEVRKFLLEKQATGLVVNNIRVIISAIFAEAVERELVLVNPAHNLGKVFCNKRPKKKTQFLTKEQVTKFISTVQQHRPEYHDFILTAFRTGMRLGELLGLAWDCVNFSTKQITVRRNYSHYHWDVPKSHKIRYVDMSEGLTQLLRERSQKRDHTVICKSEGIELVFSDKYGEPVKDTYFRRGVFYPLLKKAGLPKIRIHDTRHTYASLLLQAGAPLHYVRDQLGHSSIATTVDLYGHLTTGANRDTLNQLD